MNTIKKSKFTINKVNMINLWCYNLKFNSDCTICRCNLNTNSIYADEKGTNSYVVSGMCGHSFHYECINPWIKSNINCPLCPSKWCYSK
jgi:RING-box protein 1